MNKIRIALIIGVLAALAADSFAIDSNAGTAGLQFLKTGQGARQTAMGGAGSAASTDANALYLNPASLAFVEQAHAVFSHNQSFAGISQQGLSACFPAGDAVIGAGVVYLHMDDLAGYDIDANGAPVKIDDFTSYDMAATFSYARKLGNIPVGASVKFFQEKIQNYSVSGAALDLGAVYTVSDKVNAGLAVQNIGPAVKFISAETKLPMNVKFGLAYRHSASLLLAADADKPVDDSVKLGFGADYRLNDVLSLRGGYNSKDGLDSWLTAGIGFNLSGWSLDYTFVPFGSLGDTHRLSITAKLGK